MAAVLQYTVDGTVASNTFTGFPPFDRVGQTFQYTVTVDTADSAVGTSASVITFPPTTPHLVIGGDELPLFVVNTDMGVSAAGVAIDKDGAGDNELQIFSAEQAVTGPGETATGVSFTLFVPSKALSAEVTAPVVLSGSDLLTDAMAPFPNEYRLFVVNGDGSEADAYYYFDVDKITITNSDVPVSPPSVPLPASAPLLGAALIGLGAFGWGFRRRTSVATSELGASA